MPGSHLRRGLWLEILALALAYYGVGSLTWLLATSPGQSAALWPPAGIAVGAILLRGLALWPGVLLGAGALALQACVQTRGLPWSSAAVAALGVGCAAVVEAVLATLGIRQFVHMPPRRANDVIRLALLAAPIPAAFSAALATAALYRVGAIAHEAVPLSAAVTWLGDFFGLLIFAPLVWLLGTRHDEATVSRRVAVVIPSVFAAAIIIAAFIHTSRWDDQRAEGVLRHRADAITSTVQRSLAYHVDTLRALADFVGNSPQVSAGTFERAAVGTMVRHFAFEGLAWAPAPRDRQPIPIQIVEPRTAHKAMMGLDLATGDAAAKLSAARNSGEALVLPLEMTPDMPATSQGRALWIFVPAPGKDGEQGIQGFLGARLRIDVIVDRAVAELGRDSIAVELREAQPPGRVIHRAPSTASNAPLFSLRADAPLTVADRNFVLAPNARRTALTAEQSGEIWVVLVIGMLFVVLLEGVLLVASANRPAPPPPPTSDSNYQSPWA